MSTICPFAVRAVLTVILLSVTCVAQVPDKRRLPLQQGSRWTYDIGHGDEMPATVTIVDEGVFQLPMGGNVHQLMVVRAGTVGARFESWAMPDYGVYSYRTEQRDRRGTIDLKNKPMRLWASNRAAKEGAAGRRWQWRGPLRGQLLGMGPADPEPLDWHHEGESFGRKSIVVPLGKYDAEHVRIRSQCDGCETHEREVWLANGVGIVKQVLRIGKKEWRGQLVEYTRGKGDGSKRVRDYLDEQLKKGRGVAFNNEPLVSWVNMAPEAMRLPGRIAVVTTDGFIDTFYVDDERVMQFSPHNEAIVGAVAQRIFGAKTARPPEDEPLKPLALMLARTVAARRQLGNVCETKVTLTPPRLPQTEGRNVCVEVIGGDLDSTPRRIAVWLHAGKRSQMLIATDFPKADERK